MYVKVPLTGISPLTRVFENILNLYSKSIYVFNHILNLLMYVEFEIWFVKKLELDNFLLAPCIVLAVSSPPSSCIRAWFQSCSVGLTGTSIRMLNMESLHTLFICQQVPSLNGYSVVTRKQLMMWWLLMLMFVVVSFGERWGKFCEWISFDSFSGWLSRGSSTRGPSWRSWRDTVKIRGKEGIFCSCKVSLFLPYHPVSC